MEVSEKDIETLRAAIDGCGGSSYTQAIAILDRLSPAPEPEQPDEATVWAERVFNAAGYFFTPAHSKVAEAAGVLRELLASKDGEINKWRSYLDTEIERHRKTVAELSVLRAGTMSYRDVNEELRDELENAQEELATLRAENERLTNIVTGVRENIPMEYLRQEDVPGATGPTDRLDIVAAMRWYARDRWKLIDRLKAAERNTAEPATETTPDVDAPVDSGMNAEAVGQAELFWAQLPTNRKSASILTHEKALVCHLLSTYRTEAEARGRREALEEASKFCVEYARGLITDLQPVAFWIADELDRMKAARP